MFRVLSGWMTGLVLLLVVVVHQLAWQSLLA
jgi:hypothetical protein